MIKVKPIGADSIKFMKPLASILALLLFSAGSLHAGSAREHLWTAHKPTIKNNPCQVHKLHCECDISYPDEEIVIINRTDCHVNIRRIETESADVQPYKHYEISIHNPCDPCKPEHTLYCLHIEDGHEAGVMKLHGFNITCKYDCFCGLESAGHRFYFIPV